MRKIGSKNIIKTFTASEVGTLIEDFTSQVKTVAEGVMMLGEKMDRFERELLLIKEELAAIRVLLFRKADLERLEALERRVEKLEKTPHA